MPWYDVVAADALALGGIVPFDDLRDDRIELVVWRSASGVVAACDARCPHQWSHFAAEGVVDGEELVCTAHFWRFDTAGEGAKCNVLGRRDVKAPVTTYPVRVRDGRIEVHVEA